MAIVRVMSVVSAALAAFVSAGCQQGRPIYSRYYESSPVVESGPTSWIDGQASPGVQVFSPPYPYYGGASWGSGYVYGSGRDGNHYRHSEREFSRQQHSRPQPTFSRPQSAFRLSSSGNSHSRR